MTRGIYGITNRKNGMDRMALTSLAAAIPIKKHQDNMALVCQ
jgi:hypothetical protein